MWSAETQARVSLDHPDLTIHVEVLPRDIYFSYGREAGPGGLPVGVSGNVVVLLSGGIDSPVAAHRLMKRGCRAVFVHFHSYPFQDATSRAKAADLVQCPDAVSIPFAALPGAVRRGAARDRGRGA